MNIVQKCSVRLWTGTFQQLHLPGRAADVKFDYKKVVNTKFCCWRILKNLVIVFITGRHYRKFVSIFLTELQAEEFSCSDSTTAIHEHEHKHSISVCQLWIGIFYGGKTDLILCASPQSIDMIRACCAAVRRDRTDKCTSAVGGLFSESVTLRNGRNTIHPRNHFIQEKMVEMY